MYIKCIDTMYIRSRLAVSRTVTGHDKMMQILRDNKRKLAFLVFSLSLYGVVHAPKAAEVAQEVQHAK